MTYLANHEILASRDLHEMQVLLADLTNTDKVDLVGTGHDVAASLKYASFAGLNLFHVTYGQVPTRIHAYERDEDGVTLFLLTEGAAEVRHRGVDMVVSPGRGLVRDSRSRLIARQDGFSSFVMPIANTVLQRHARTLYGEEAGLRKVELPQALDFTTPGGQQFRHTVEYIAAALDGPLRNCSNRLVLEGLRDLFLNQVLTLLPNSCASQMRGGAGPILPYHIKRARDFMHSHAGSAITLELLAAHAGCSYRTLQMGFHEAYGVSPMAYLRRLRLKRAHQDLREADDGVSVREIALKWGFVHTSRFSKAYQREFGVLPSHSRRMRD